MKKILTKSIYFCLGLFLIILIGLLLPNNSTQRSIDYSLKAKHKLLQETKSPKVILTGGSNVIFGFNSKLLSENLKKPVVNHAIHAGYGLKYILDDVEKYVEEGDMLLVSPEYSHFLDDNYLGSEPILFSLTVEPQNIKLLSFEQIFNALSFAPKFSLDRIRSFSKNILIKKPIDSTDVYSQFSINEYGDNYKHWNLEKTIFQPYEFTGEINKDVLNYLKKYNDRINLRGAKLIILFPSLCETSYKINRKTIKSIEKELKSTNLNVVGTPEDFTYKDSLFFDTPYHLNGKGVYKRTLIVGDLLK